LGGYFEKSLVDDLQALADSMDIDRSELIQQILQAAVGGYHRTGRHPKSNIALNEKPSFSAGTSSKKDIAQAAEQSVPPPRKPKAP
jgi:hypothetical protein